MAHRTIKKYANRRLYDVETSRYITQAELKDLIVSGVVVRVVDAKTGRDRTREVLLQIVSEQEQMGVPILSESLLLALIRFYGHPLQQMAARYLEASFGGWVAQSRDLADRMQRATLSPAEFMNRLASGGLDWLQQVQATMREAPHEAAASRSNKKSTDKENPK